MDLLIALVMWTAQTATANASFTASASPVLQVSVARGATRVPLMNVHVEASCDESGPLVIQSIGVRQVGLGASTDLVGVYLLEDGTRLSRLHTIEQRSRTATIRPRALRLEPCASRDFQIAVDISPDASAASEHGLILESVTGRSADGQVSATVINQSTSSPSRVAPVTEEPPTFVERELSGRITYGGGRRVLRFLLEAGDDDLLINAITFENEGKARDKDLQNIRITDASGDTLTTVLPSMDGDRVRLIFTPPLRLDRNEEKLLELRADVRASVRKTVQFELGEQSDIEWQPAGR